MEQELDIGLEQVKLQAVDVEKELLVLRLAFGKLRAVATQAFAPVTAPLLEGLQKAVFWATRLVKNIGIVLSALTGLRAGQESYTRSVTKTVKALRRELAGFDELNRLGTPKSGVVTAQITVDPETFTVPAQLQGIIDGIRAALAPLQSCPWSGIFTDFRRRCRRCGIPLSPGFNLCGAKCWCPLPGGFSSSLCPRRCSACNRQSRR